MKQPPDPKCVACLGTGLISTLGGNMLPCVCTNSVFNKKK